MPRLVVVSRYLKSGNNKKLSNYVKYIATREGAATVKENSGTAPATEKQQELISSMLKDFPNSSSDFTYEAYKKEPTQKNASRFIDETLEHYADIIANKKNYIAYLANRPGAVKFGSHGLFSQTDEPINLNKVAKEVANHNGNVWTHIVSLRRDDAQKMGYDNLTAWRELVKRQIPNIAKQSKFDMANLKWYAAYHDKETNPHVHIVVYSTNEREGFLTKQGSEKIRSGFMNDIYTDELKHLYQQQTDIRDLLKSESTELMKKLSADVSTGRSVDTETIELMIRLHEQLQSAKGKKVYGYLKKDVKQTVDDIFFRLSQNESIKKMYKLWCDMEQTKHDFYSSAKVEFPSMVDNENFKSVKNMIIRSAAKMQFDIPVAEDDAIIDDIEEDTEPIIPDEYDYEPADTEESSGNYYFKWSDEDKSASRILKSKDATDDEKSDALAVMKSEADKGDAFAAYKLGKIYFKGEYVTVDYDKAEKYLLAAADNNNHYAMYQLARLYMTDEKYDIKKAIKLFEKVADKNMWASYWLGRIYLFGKDGITPDKEKAVEWLTKSAADGNEYAEKLLNYDGGHSYMISNTIVSLLADIGRFIEEDHARSRRKMSMKVDKKLQRMIQKKKSELGIKSGGMDMHYEY
ncbi:MAG: SEL1-like repeat protein [Ruminococcus sp.]|nr:SEL1-like repeat protein [Ruminococcus sp.]